MSNICFDNKIAHLKSKEMLKMISGAAFAKTIIAMACIYYLVVVALYYRKEIKRLITRRRMHENRGDPPVK
jgi:hypothetical protein